MQTQKQRIGSSEAPQRRKRSPQSVSSKVPTEISPQPISQEVRRKSSPRNSSHYTSLQKVSPRVARKLLPENSGAKASSHVISSPKQRSPKGNEQRSPHSLGYETRPSRHSELESQIFELQNDLKKVKEELRFAEALKNQANQEADESKKQLSLLSSKLEESQELLWKQTFPKATQSENLKENLPGTLLLVEEMKAQLRDCKVSEAQAKALVNETLLQLEAARRTAETIRSEETQKALEMEISSMKSEIESLSDALEASEVRNTEEETLSTIKIRSAYEFVERMLSSSNQKEAELKAEVQKLSAKVEELKANLMDKETELQGICEENENLALELENRRSGQEEMELEREIQCVKENLAKKEAEMKKMSDENAEMGAEMRRMKVQCEQWRKAAEAAAAILSPGEKERFAEKEDGDEDLQKRKNANMVKRLGISWKKQHK
ncbi:unnamed protein product [Cuscuta campestris]|uniref:Uncharacterized protein n=1 Tax=Cuscuta campestris TaxID=132261 RepID=A0A484LE19_9ASTE|nr:unnamed protein product [Cuscuta campestris]